MPLALFLSPHLDDVAFSCGGTLIRLLSAPAAKNGGWSARVETLFTASVPAPQGFALRCQTDKGLASNVDYMALRRNEDYAFARIAGEPDVWHGPFREAPHRGYDSAQELFAGMHDEDQIWTALADNLRENVTVSAPALLFAPQGLGSHVDHLQLIRALCVSGLTDRVIWYRDTPYAIREPEARLSSLLPPGLHEFAVPLSPEILTRKIAGCCAYASQIGFQFGGPDGVAEKLTAFHRAEAERAGLAGFAERLLAPEMILPLLEELFAQ